jgi:hypothetical protein
MYMRSSKPKFTKRDYQFLARVLAEMTNMIPELIHKGTDKDDAVVAAVTFFAAELKGTNPAYDMGRFIEAVASEMKAL